MRDFFANLLAVVIGFSVTYFILWLLIFVAEIKFYNGCENRNAVYLTTIEKNIVCIVVEDN